MKDQGIITLRRIRGLYLCEGAGDYNFAKEQTAGCTRGSGISYRCDIRKLVSLKSAYYESKRRLVVPVTGSDVL